MNNLVIIAAVGRNGELGYKGGLCWRIGEDLRSFRDITMGHYVVMGRRTYQGMPKLAGRKYIVISEESDDTPDVRFFTSIKDFLSFAKKTDEIIYVIGGGMIYTQLLPYCDEMILTEINAECKQADVYFPRFDKTQWKIERQESKTNDDISYKRVWYKRGSR